MGKNLKNRKKRMYNSITMLYTQDQQHYEPTVLQCKPKIKKEKETGSKVKDHG